jgi:hypothetical protein
MSEPSELWKDKPDTEINTCTYKQDDKRHAPYIAGNLPQEIGYLIQSGDIHEWQGCINYGSSPKISE